MICPDCEMEVDKLTRKGICHKCNVRLNNVNYRNKKFGTSDAYIPLKYIKGTPEYNKAMGKRLHTMKKYQEKIATEKPKNNIMKTNITSIEGYDYIDINSDKLLGAINYLKTCLDRVPEMDEQVSKMQEELLLITHKKLDTNGPGDKHFDELNAREYAIIKYRRQLKDALVYLRRINTDILNDDLVETLDETQKNYEGDQYVPKYARDDKKQYSVSVNVNGLNHVNQIVPFKRVVYAKDDISAKQYVESYLKTLNGITIFGKSWSIKEIEKED